MEDGKARVQLTLYADVWRGIRVIAAEEGTTASELVEAALIEKYGPRLLPKVKRVRLPELDDQGAPIPRKGFVVPAALLREAQASVALDHDEKEGTQSLPPVDHNSSDHWTPDELVKVGEQVPPNVGRRAAGFPAATSTSDPPAKVVDPTSASTTGSYDSAWAHSRPAPKPGTKPAPRRK